MMWPARFAMGLCAVVAGPVIYTLIWPDQGTDTRGGAVMDPAALVSAAMADTPAGPPVRVILDSPFGPVAAGPSARQRPVEPVTAAAEATSQRPIRDTKTVREANTESEAPARTRVARKPAMQGPIDDLEDFGWDEPAPAPAPERRARQKRTRSAEAGWARPVVDRRERLAPMPFFSFLER